MKITLLIITNFLFSQSTGFSLYGVGEYYGNSYPASIALGNINYFSGNTNDVVENSSSSYWKSSLTRFVVNSGLSSIIENSGHQYSQHRFTSFSLSFPIGNKKVLGLGLRPMYRFNNLNIYDDDYSYIGADMNPSGSPIAMKNSYNISGGISNLYLIYSQQINKKLSLGAKLSKLLGAQSRYDKLYTYDISFINSTDIEYIENNVVDVTYLNVFDGSELDLEGRLHLANHEYVASFSFIGKTEIKSFKTVSSETDTNIFSQSPFIHNIGLGYQYLSTNSWGVISEIHKLFQFGVASELAFLGISPPSENSFHLGCFRQYSNSKIGIWNKIILRTGIFVGNQVFDSQIFSEKSNFTNYGFATGIGLEFLNSSHLIDVSIKLGIRESIMFINNHEKYFSIHLGITSGEKWFLKRREK